MKKSGFTLIEVLVVIAIIAILASILIPLAGGAKETALKRRAATEMQSIKVATMQFYADHKYMPWPTNGLPAAVGEDKWTTDAADQSPVMALLTTNNVMGKLYLQIPEKSRPADKSMVFNDPWGQPYQIGMDRNMDGKVEVLVVPENPEDTESATWNGKRIMEKVLVYSPGPPLSKPYPLKTFDIIL